MAEITVLLTEVTCESPKSKLLLKNMAALASCYGCLDKNSPWRGRLGDRYAGSLYEKK